MPLVLIVDDNDKNRKLAHGVLSAAGFRTLEAATGAQGLALAAEHLPDVILMDLRLPDMDGTEAARAIGKGSTARIPVVAWSAMRLEGSGEWLRAAGFSGWLEKPIEVTAFAEQVRRYCSEATE